MIDPTKAARRVAALTLIPTSVAVFGAGLAWANSHDPYAGASTDSSSGQASDPALAAAQAKVDDAQAKLAKLQAEVDGRSTDPATSASATDSASASASGTTTPSAAGSTKAGAAATTAAAKAAAAAKTTAAAKTVAAAPAPAPVVQTTTKASKKP